MRNKLISNSEQHLLDDIELVQTNGGMATLNPEFHILPFPLPKCPPYPIGGPIKLPIILPIGPPVLAL